MTQTNEWKPLTPKKHGRSKITGITISVNKGLLGFISDDAVSHFGDSDRICFLTDGDISRFAVRSAKGSDKWIYKISRRKATQSACLYTGLLKSAGFSTGHYTGHEEGDMLVFERQEHAE